MGDPRVGRFRKHFPVYVYQNIAACLNERQGVGATILICCAIDTLSKYATAGSQLRGNKARYIEFLTRYFPSTYDPQAFYRFVRSGLVHAFDMERQYAILCSKETWAQQLHMMAPPGKKRPIVNPYVLFRHLKQAQKKLADDLDADRVLRRHFVRVYRAAPIRPQNYTIGQVREWIVRPEITSNEKGS